MIKILKLTLLFVVFSTIADAQTFDQPAMVFIQGGSFNMGSNNGMSIEKPVHAVTINSFNIGKYEVTVVEYKAFCKATGHSMPTTFSLKVGRWNDMHPMRDVSFDDATAYCNWLSDMSNVNYRLPTEAEWEYAARGGNQSRGYIYSGSDDLDEVGWNIDNSGKETHSIGRKKPNELGIYDMTGNVWEWCSDWYDGNYYAYSPASNPKGPTSGDHRVLRGGSWSFPASICRVAMRYDYSPADYLASSFGFRVVSSN